MTELETCINNLMKWQAMRRHVYRAALTRAVKDKSYLAKAMADIRQAPPKTLVDSIERLIGGIQA